MKNILLIFLVSILIAVFLTLPLLQGFLESRAELENRKEELQGEEEYIAKLRMTEEEIEKQKEKLELIELSVPDTSSVVPLIYHIERLSQNYGMYLGEIGSHLVVPSADFYPLREISMNFSVTGLYSSFRNFIRVLENSEKIINIERVLITSHEDVEEGEESEFLSFELFVKVYSY